MPVDLVHPPLWQLAITVAYTRGIATITLVGELDVAVVDDVREAVKLVVAKKGLSSMHLDIQRVSFMDSTGLGILTWTRRIALDGLLTFSLAMEPDGPVARVIGLCGADDLFAGTQRPRFTPVQ